MNVLKHLVAAREAIASPVHWCQGYRYRLTKDGIEQRCALGALLKAAGHNDFDDIAPVVAVLAATIPRECRYSVLDGPTVAAHNNTHTHAEVLAMFDTAIARQQLIEKMLDVDDIDSCTREKAYA